MKGRLKRTIVSKSQPVMLKAPSPNRHTTSLSGWASFEAMANGTPTPRVPSGPSVAIARCRLRHGRQDRPDVADQAERNVAVLADRAVIHVDLHDRRPRRQPPPVAHAEVERRPDDDDDVRVLERVRARQLEVMRIAWRQGPAPRAVHEGRHVQCPAERDRGVRPPAGPDLATEEDAGL